MFKLIYGVPQDPQDQGNDNQIVLRKVLDFVELSFNVMGRKAYFRQPDYRVRSSAELPKSSDFVS